jgi:hypothetical protein
VAFLDPGTKRKRMVEDLNGIAVSESPPRLPGG